MTAEVAYKTLRDEFAMAALTGMLADPAVQIGDGQDEHTARWCYKIADAMLRAREEEPK